MRLIARVGYSFNMPELPEVETTVRGLKKKIVGWKIKGGWTDFRKMVKKPSDFKDFTKQVKGKTVIAVQRRGKNILINLSEGKTILIHQKMTGHLLIGHWKLKNGKWISQTPGVIKNDSKNQFLHFMLFFNRGRQVALSDVRKFAKIELWDTDKLFESEDFNSLGPEPLEKSFTFSAFKEVLRKRKKGKIKQVLMDQKIISGIGNIYSDEILWRANVNPFKDINSLKDREKKKIYLAVKYILEKAIRAKGDSISDYRGVDGQKGNFGRFEKVYSREGEKCFRCQSIIKRRKIGGRSAHFCPFCQK